MAGRWSFFWHFFDLFGKEIYDAVEETWVQAKINEVMNSTYLTRIPKKNRPDTFNDFRHISLCSLLYKTVSKIIAERLKPFLGNALSREKFAFLPDRKIIDAVGIFQECLHSLKIQKNYPFFLKLDLLKAYDRVYWSFRRLNLI